MKKCFLRKFTALLLAGSMLTVGCQKSEIDDINDRLDKLESGTIAPIEAQMEAMQGSLDDLSALLNSKGANWDEAIASLGSSVNGLESTVNGLDAAVSELGESNAAIVTSVESIIANVETVQTSVEALEDKDAELALLIDEQQKYIDENFVSGAELESTLKNYAKVEELTAALAEIDALKKAVVDNKAAVDAQINDLKAAVADKADAAELEKVMKQVTELQAGLDSINKEFDSFVTNYETVFGGSDMDTIKATIQGWAGELLAPAMAKYFDASSRETAEWKSFEAAFVALLNDAVAEGGIIYNSVYTPLNNEIVKLQDAIKNIETASKLTQDQINKILAQVQSVSYVPTHQDKMVHLSNYAMYAADWSGNGVQMGDLATKPIVISYDIKPAAIADSLLAVYKATPSAFAIVFEKVSTKAADATTTIASMVKGDKDGRLAVEVKVENLPAASTFSTLALALTIKQEATDMMSEYAALVTDEIKVAPVVVDANNKAITEAAPIKYPLYYSGDKDNKNKVDVTSGIFAKFQLEDAKGAIVTLAELEKLTGSSLASFAPELQDIEVADCVLGNNLVVVKDTDNTTFTYTTDGEDTAFGNTVVVSNITFEYGKSEIVSAEAGATVVLTRNAVTLPEANFTSKRVWSFDTKASYQNNILFSQTMAQFESYEEILENMVMNNIEITYVDEVKGSNPVAAQKVTLVPSFEYNNSNVLELTLTTTSADYDAAKLFTEASRTYSIEIVGTYKGNTYTIPVKFTTEGYKAKYESDKGTNSYGYTEEVKFANRFPIYTDLNTFFGSTAAKAIVTTAAGNGVAKLVNSADKADKASAAMSSKVVAEVAKDAYPEGLELTYTLDASAAISKSTDNLAMTYTITIDETGMPYPIKYVVKEGYTLDMTKTIAAINPNPTYLVSGVATLDGVYYKADATSVATGKADITSFGIDKANLESYFIAVDSEGAIVKDAVATAIVYSFEFVDDKKVGTSSISATNVLTFLTDKASVAVKGTASYDGIKIADIAAFNVEVPNANRPIQLTGATVVEDNFDVSSANNKLYVSSKLDNVFVGLDKVKMFNPEYDGTGEMFITGIAFNDDPKEGALSNSFADGVLAKTAYGATIEFGTPVVTTAAGAAASIGVSFNKTTGELSVADAVSVVQQDINYDIPVTIETVWGEVKASVRVVIKATK